MIIKVSGSYEVELVEFISYFMCGVEGRVEK